MDELFCEEHGPYPAYLGSCPACAQKGRNMPPAPAPLYRSEDVTSDGSAGVGYENQDTILPGMGAGQGGPAAEADDATQPPRHKGKHSAIGDEDEQTRPPERKKPGYLDDRDEEMTVIDRPDTSLMGWLIVKTSPCLRRGHILKVKSGAIYGRSTNKADYVIDDEKVSSIHMRLLIKEGKFYVFDLGSANGTRLNGQEITGSTELHQDDEIKIGNSVFVLKTLE